MLIAMIEYNKLYYGSSLRKLNRVGKKVPIHVDMFAREGTVYVMGLDDGLSATFVYMAYLKAKERGLQASLMYARFIDESWLPEEVKKLGKKWLYQKLGVKEIEELKKVTITEYVFDKW
jgi:hypothetical protein